MYKSGRMRAQAQAGRQGVPAGRLARIQIASDSLGGRRARHGDAAAILRPGRLAVAWIVRPLLAVADGLDAVRRDAEGNQVVLDRGRAPVAERQVVLAGAALVAMTLDGHGLR